VGWGGGEMNLKDVRGLGDEGGYEQCLEPDPEPLQLHASAEPNPAPDTKLL
jgi:hypothetical protein